MQVLHGQCQRLVPQSRPWARSAGHASPPHWPRLRKASPAAWSCNPQQGCRRLLRQSEARRTQQWQASAAAAAGADASQPSQQQTLLAAAAAVMVRLWQQALAGLAAGMQRLRTAPDAEQAEEMNTNLRHGVRGARRLLAVAPFAAVRTGNEVHLAILVTKAVTSFVEFYLLLLFIRVLLSWFPVFKWDRQPWLSLRQVTDPYLTLFRGLVPPLLGAIDFTPLFGFLLLQQFASFLQIEDMQDDW